MATTSEKVRFTISGEFITNYARTIFWNEHQPYKKAEKILLCALQHPQLTPEKAKQLAQEIIECRYRLVGENTLTIEPDPGPVRPILTRMTELEDELELYKIKNQMETEPLLFVDPFSTCKSIRALQEGITSCGIGSYTLPQIMHYFATDSNGILSDKKPDMYAQTLPAYKPPFMAGLWLFEQPELVLRVCKTYKCKPGTHDFWAGIYQETKDDEDATQRNMHYEAWLRQRQSDTNLVSDTNIRKTAQEQSAKSKRDKEAEMLRNTKPDDMLSWYGLIDPEGHFYSCTFGGHEVKAEYIILSRPDIYENLTPEEEELWKNKDKGDILNKALDILSGRGWASTRSIYIDSMHYVSRPRNGRELTKAQERTVYDAAAKFHKRVQYENDIRL